MAFEVKLEGVPQVDELRPITLLNSDYKILSKLLVKRMKPVLHKVITSSQLCSVDGKNILFGVNNVLSSILYINNHRKKACILSYDFFKAYDRVFLPYLHKVMLKMKFSKTFCDWIMMMHDGASTCFILEQLSEEVQLSFSIRQGDPLAMILYIIYIEPLLLHLERSLVGVDINGIPEVLESFCDDVNIVTEHTEDLLKADVIVSNFEKMSGAILSRNNKCKILGIGDWKSREDWPIEYVQSVKELKVFGIFLKNSYRSLISRNWQFRYEKFFNCLKS